MKKLLAILSLSFFLCTVGGLAACDKEEGANSTPTATQESENSSEPVEQGEEITGVVFANARYTYDGTERELAASNLPDGVSAAYTQNKGTDAGTYNAQVVLSGEGYITKTLTAVLTIDKAILTGVSLEENGKVTYDGEFHLPTVSGLPTDASLAWKFDGKSADDGVKEVGEYEVSVTVSSKNYKDVVLEGIFSIKRNLSTLASQVITALGRANAPAPWSFLPSSFAISNKTIAADHKVLPTQTQENPYANGISISEIPVNYIGKQMNVVYGVLNTCDTALGYVSKVHTVMNTIEALYQAFLDKDPQDYQVHTGTAGGFTYTIELNGNDYTLTASISGVEVCLFGNASDRTYGARVQLTESNVLKYEVSDSGLTIAWDVLGSASTMVVFTRNGSAIEGVIYEYLTVKDKELKASSTYLEVGTQYTTVVGTKGDFIPTTEGRNCEVYDNATGQLVGTEVSEKLTDSKAFHTLWYRLTDITGITSVKKVDDAQKANPDTIWLNGSSERLHSDVVNLILNPSRIYDIEFKEVCAYVYDAAKENYTLKEFEVPMLFVQEEYINTFAGKFAESNKMNKTDDPIAISVNRTEQQKAAVRHGYYDLLPAYNAIKNSVTQEMIQAYCAK